MTVTHTMAALAQQAAGLEQQLVLVITFNTILGTIGARIVFRQIVVNGLDRQFEVMVALLVAWVLWTYFYVVVGRALKFNHRRQHHGNKVEVLPPSLVADWVGRLATNFTYVFTMIFFFYTNDFVDHTTLVYGMSLAQATVYVVGGILIISTLQTLLQNIALFHLHDMATLPSKQENIS